MSELPFDANSVEPSQALEPIPAGWYSVVIEESGIVPRVPEPQRETVTTINPLEVGYFPCIARPIHFQRATR